MKLDMSEAIHYDIAAALRGPDRVDPIIAYRLKAITTAVMRWLIGLRHTHDLSLSLESPEAAKLLWASWDEESKRQVIGAWQSNNHFANHLFIGLRSLQTPEAVQWIQWLRNELGT